MTSECVLDAEILKKYCSDKKHDSADELMESCLKQGINDIYFFKECFCLVELLDAISVGKCMMCYTNRVIEEYTPYIDKLPQNLLDYMSSILSDPKRSKRVEGALIHLSEISKIESTSLKHKKIYLDAAKALTNRRIVSTNENVSNIYNPNIKILILHQISCKNICDQWDEIKHS